MSSFPSRFLGFVQAPAAPWAGMTAAHALHAAAQTALLFAPSAAVIVGGIPGAGKTTFLARTVRPGDARVLDSAQVRRRLRARLGRRVPYALYRPLVHVIHLLRVWRALAAREPVVVHDCATRGPLRRLIAPRAPRARRRRCSPRDSRTCASWTAPRPTRSRHCASASRVSARARRRLGRAAR